MSNTTNFSKAAEPPKEFSEEIESLRSMTAQDRIKWARHRYLETLAALTDFGPSSPAFLHMVQSMCPGLPVVCADTGHSSQIVEDRKNYLTKQLNLNLITPDLNGYEEQTALLRTLRQREISAVVTDLPISSCEGRIPHPCFEMRDDRIEKIYPLVGMHELRLTSYMRRYGLTEFPIDTQLDFNFEPKP